MTSECQVGKIRNPISGRCVFKNSPVLKNNPILPKTPKEPKLSSGPQELIKQNIIIKCGPTNYINPRTRRCVQLTNPDIKKYIKKGYVLQTVLSPDVKEFLKPSTIPKINIYDDKNKNNPDLKVVVPPNTIDKVKLVYCGPDKVINPTTKRCIKLSGPLGKKLTTVPYIIVNPPSKPQKTPLFIKDPNIKKPQKGPYQQIPFPKTKEEKIKTALDTDEDNYVSIKEYLDATESLGPAEKSGGKNFAFYNQRDLAILFILNLIKHKRGPIHHIGCIPLYHLCIYKNLSGTFYTMENIKSQGQSICDISTDVLKLQFNAGNITNTYASIVVLNTPRMNQTSSNTKLTQVLIPPNLKQLIKNCEIDGKYMVVCDLTLIQGEDIYEVSHANVLIFDTKRKTIERFDPHGANEYSDVKLVYDTGNIGTITGTKDFKFGKIKSNALFDQLYVDTKIRNRLQIELPDYTYYGTNVTTPYLGPQVKVDEYKGLCVTWSCMYMVLRLLNPDLSPAEVTIKMIDGTPEQIKNRILRFQKFIIKTLSKEKTDLKRNR